MPRIEISLDHLATLVSDIRLENQKLDDAFSDLSRCIQGLEESWEGEAAIAYHESFIRMTPRFRQYQEVIESYATFLDQTIENYRLTEMALMKNAENFQ